MPVFVLLCLFAQISLWWDKKPRWPLTFLYYAIDVYHLTQTPLGIGGYMVLSQLQKVKNDKKSIKGE